MKTPLSTNTDRPEKIVITPNVLFVSDKSNDGRSDQISTPVKFVTPAKRFHFYNDETSDEDSPKAKSRKLLVL